MDGKTASGGWCDCEHCQYNDPDSEYCDFPWEGLCWEEIRDGEVEIVMDDFGNMMAISTNPDITYI